MKFISSLSRIDFYRETSLQVSLTLIKNLDETFIYLWIIIRVFIKYKLYFYNTSKAISGGVTFCKGRGCTFCTGRGCTFCTGGWCIESLQPLILLYETCQKRYPFRLPLVQKRYSCYILS